MIIKTSIDLKELANQCLKTWSEIKKHQMLLEWQEEVGKKPVGNPLMDNEIVKLKNLFNESSKVYFESEIDYIKRTTEI